MKTVCIYDKSDLSNVIERPVTSFEDFESRIKEYFPNYDPKNYIYTAEKYINPVIDKGKLREMAKEELYAVGKYTLADNEILENGKIKVVELSEWEYIEDGKIQFNRDKKIEEIEKELYKIRLEYDVEPFEYEVNGEKYLQNNRSIDQSNLTRIGVKLQMAGKKEFKNWKFYTEDNGEVYKTISMQDILKMSDIMELQTTKSMKTETILKEKLPNLSDEELKNFNSEKEFKDLWDK